MSPFLLVAALAAAPLAHAASASLPSVDSRLSSSEVALGEPFSWTVTLKHDPAETYSLSAPTGWGPFSLIEQTVVSEPGSGTTTVTAKLALFDLRTANLPSLSLTSGDARPPLVVEGPAVTAKPTLPAGSELLDLDGPVPVFELHWVRIFAISLLGLAGVCAAAFAARFFWKRHRRPLPLPERTYRALTSLEQEGLVERGETREFHYRLSAIVRGYLAERFDVVVSDCTSRELLERLDGKRAELPREELVHHLRRSDSARFAPTAAEGESCHEGLSFGRRLVALTPFPPEENAHARTDAR